MSMIKDRLQEDWKTALKAKDKFKAGVLSTTKAAVLQIEKNEGIKLEDDRVIEVLAREIKQRREAIAEFEKGGRQDLVDANNAEIEILLDYLPKQLSQEEILEIVKAAAVESGATTMKDMGKVMAIVRPQTVGRADGKIVSQVIKDYLNSK